MLVSLMFPFTLAGTYTEAQGLCRTLENNAKCKCGVKVYISLWNTSKQKLTTKCSWQSYWRFQGFAPSEFWNLLMIHLLKISKFSFSLPLRFVTCIMWAIPINGCVSSIWITTSEALMHWKKGEAGNCVWWPFLIELFPLSQV